MVKDNKGFTLIELVMVIVILAVLAAVAIPRFLDLRTEARDATASGITASLRTAISLLHAQYLIRNTQYNVGSTDIVLDTTGVIGSAGIQGVTTIAVSATTPAAGAQATINIQLSPGITYTWLYTQATFGSTGVAARLSDAVRTW